MKPLSILLLLLVAGCTIQAQQMPWKYPDNPIVIDTILFDRIVPGPGMTIAMNGRDRYLERQDSKTEVFWERFIQCYEEYLVQNPTGTPKGFIPYMKKRSVREMREALKKLK